MNEGNILQNPNFTSISNVDSLNNGGTDLDKDEVQSLKCMAFLLLQTSQFQKAYQVLTLVSSVMPKDVEVIKMRAFLFYQTGRYQECFEAIRPILMTSKPSLEKQFAHKIYSSLCHKANYADEAFKSYKHYLKIRHIRRKLKRPVVDSLLIDGKGEKKARRERLSKPSKK